MLLLSRRVHRYSVLPLPTRHLAFTSKSKGHLVQQMKGRCLRCGSQGHVAAECRNARVCFACGQTGHILSSCPFLSHADSPSLNTKNLSAPIMASHPNPNLRQPSLGSKPPIPSSSSAPRLASHQNPNPISVSAPPTQTIPHIPSSSFAQSSSFPPLPSQPLSSHQQLHVQSFRDASQPPLQSQLYFQPQMRSPQLPHQSQLQHQPQMRSSQSPLQTQLQDQPPVRPPFQPLQQMALMHPPHHPNRRFPYPKRFQAPPVRFRPPLPKPPSLSHKPPSQTDLSTSTLRPQSQSSEEPYLPPKSSSVSH